VSRRAVVAASAASLAAATIARRAQADEPKLHVLLALDLTPRALQNALRGALTGVDVIVYGRVGDFVRGIREAPHAALAIPESLAAFGLQPRLRGSNNGQVTEEYVLAAIGEPPNPKTIESVGVVDLFGREQLVQFVARALGATPAVKSVTKVADILPLLNLGMAAAAIVPRSTFETLRGRTSQTLANTSISMKVGRPALGGTASEVIARVKALPADVNSKLGIDAWV